MSGKLKKVVMFIRLFFSLVLVKGLHSHARVERRSRETRETRAAPSVARGHLRISRVLLDGEKLLEVYGEMASDNLSAQKVKESQ